MSHRDDSAAMPSSSDIDGRRALLLRRPRRIRRSVALFAAALFSAAFLMVYVQLALGHDPGLVADARRASAQVAPARSASGTPMTQNLRPASRQ